MRLKWAMCRQWYSLESLIQESLSQWTETEWGFPKGRHNNQEKDLLCALREFEEETGLKNIKFIENLLPYEEIFTGSNFKSYKHKYYIAYFDASSSSSDEEEAAKKFQNSEVSKIDWKTYNDGINSIRTYNLEKKSVLSRVNKLLLEYRLYQ
jgi:8-oxo-dGTP pyrophosphatase MutT (NUDIX family)